MNLNSICYFEYYSCSRIFTLYTKSLPLDVACRVWDMFCRDGDVFLFRTALGQLLHHQESFVSSRALCGGQNISKVPPTH